MYVYTSRTKDQNNQEKPGTQLAKQSKEKHYSDGETWLKLIERTSEKVGEPTHAENEQKRSLLEKLKTLDKILVGMFSARLTIKERLAELSVLVGCVAVTALMPPLSPFAWSAFLGVAIINSIRTNKREAEKRNMQDDKPG